MEVAVAGREDELVPFSLVMRSDEVESESDINSLLFFDFVLDLIVVGVQDRHPANWAGHQSILRWSQSNFDP